jgi:glycine/D-amino acid oxidase-like deaminating enzyme
MTPMPIPGADPAFAHGPDRLLPQDAEVVVIGGGGVGVTAALTLAERGVPVVLCEKGRIAGEQSSRNWGWIRNQRRDIREIPLMLEAQALWRRHAARLDRDIGLREKGIAYLALTEDELAGHEAWLEETRGFQLSSRMLSPAEAGVLVGQDDGRFKGGIFTPTDMHAEPALAVPALARLAAQAGARIFEGCAVRAVERAGGRTTGVITEHGRISCQSVILAGGAWSRTFMENMDVSLPQLAIRSQAFRTAPVDVHTAGPVGTSRAAIRPRRDGGVTVGRSHSGRFDIIPAAFTHFRAFLPHALAHWRTMKFRFGPEFFGALGRHRWAPDQLSPFETARVLDPVPDPGIIQAIHAQAAKIYPQLQGVPIAEAWGGMIDVMPDEIPVIGAPSGLEGLILATGLSGHGFGLGPGTGHLAADLATGAEPLVDPAPYNPTRFERT